MNIPKLIKEYRVMLGETQEAFGTRFNVSHAAVSDWERGKSNPPALVVAWALSERSNSVLQNRPLSYGKMFEQFKNMVQSILDGHTLEIHHPKYVVMSRKRYEQLVAKLQPKPKIYYDEMTDWEEWKTLEGRIGVVERPSGTDE